MGSMTTEEILPRILIVDDEAAQMHALRDTLRDHGYETVGFTGGEPALAALREAKFELLLTDLMMPGMDGIALLQAAREMQPDLLGIIMTGEGTITTAVEAMKVGAFDYILKPFKLSAILPVLARALAMRQLRIENAELERRLKERATELEIANKELEAFTFSVSHDLRSPLKTIEKYTAMIQKQLDGKLDELGEHLFKIVRNSSQRMATLVDEMLAFSKLGREPMSVSMIDMTMLANEAWAEVRVDSPDGAPDFRLATLPSALGDYSLLRQVWINLLSNAVKYSAKIDEPLIEVSARSGETEVVYRVSDNGAGFDMRHYDKLFEVFHRLHSERDFPGTGVGLAIVQRVVTRHGGRVWAKGEVNAGAEFFFSLPVSAVDIPG